MGSNTTVTGIINFVDAEIRLEHCFSDRLLAEIAQRCSGDTGALEKVWKQGVAHSVVDGIITQTEETRLQEFRDRLALSDELDPAFTADYHRKSG